MENTDQRITRWMAVKKVKKAEEEKEEKEEQEQEKDDLEEEDEEQEEETEEKEQEKPTVKWQGSLYKKICGPWYKLEKKERRKKEREKVEKEKVGEIKVSKSEELRKVGLRIVGFRKVGEPCPCSTIQSKYLHKRLMQVSGVTNYFHFDDQLAIENGNTSEPESL